MMDNPDHTHTIEQQRAQKKEKLRILFVPLWYPSPYRGRSSGAFCQEHVEAVAKYVEIKVVHAVVNLKARLFSSIKHEQNQEYYTLQQLEIGGAPMPKTAYVPWQPQLYYTLQKEVHHFSPDLIHAHDDNGIVVARLSQKYNIPFVLSQHWSKFERNTYNTLDILSYKYAFKHATYVLPSNFFAEKTYKKLGLEAKVKWIPNTYDPDIFHYKRNNLKPYFLHVSRMVELKRVDDILSAFQRIVNRYPFMQLLLVGGEKESNNYQKKIENLNLADHVKILGHRTKRNIASLMQSAKGFILPSEMETFGVVLIEAMACGCPVLTTPRSGVKAVVRNESEGILVEPGDIDQIEKGMIKLVEGTHGLNTHKIAMDVQTRFAKEEVGKMLYRVYQNVVLEKIPN